MAKEYDSNTVGASLFWLYIVAALFFTAIILKDLLVLRARTNDTPVIKNYGSLRLDARRRRSRHAFLLSLMSFAILSYHMLAFRIVTYVGWRRQHSVDNRLLQMRDITSLKDLRATMIHLWTWSRSSTLFADFAQALCGSPEGFWWTQQALLYTFAWNIFMSIEGTRFQVPHLWNHFILGQILPNSFTQNLFSAALYLIPSNAVDETLVPATRPKQLATIAMFLVALYFAPVTANTPLSLSSLLGTRVCLFAPYFFLRPSYRSLSTAQGQNGVHKYFNYKSLLAFSSLFMHLLQTWRATSVPKAFVALNDNHAVAALGYDYLLGLVSGIFLLRT